MRVSIGPSTLDLTAQTTEREAYALAQLDCLLEWMESKIKSTKKVRSCCFLDISDFTLGQEPRILVRQLDTRERHPDYRGTTFSQR